MAAIIINVVVDVVAVVVVVDVITILVVVIIFRICSFMFPLFLSKVFVLMFSAVFKPLKFLTGLKRSGSKFDAWIWVYHHCFSSWCPVMMKKLFSKVRIDQLLS